MNLTESMRSTLDLLNEDADLATIRAGQVLQRFIRSDPEYDMMDFDDDEKARLNDVASAWLNGDYRAGRERSKNGTGLAATIDEILTNSPTGNAFMPARDDNEFARPPRELGANEYADDEGVIRKGRAPERNHTHFEPRELGANEYADDDGVIRKGRAPERTYPDWRKKD